MQQVSKALFVGLALVTLVTSNDTEKPFSSICRRKLGQILCSSHYEDHLLECLQSLDENSFIRQGSEICLRPVPEYCVAGNLCDKLEAPKTDELPPTVKPQTFPLPSNPDKTKTKLEDLETSHPKLKVRTMDTNDKPSPKDDESDGSDNNSSHNLGLALASSVWFWVTLTLCLALLAAIVFSIWQHGQLQVFRVLAQPTEQIPLQTLSLEPALPDNNEEQEAQPAPPPPVPNLNAWADEPEPVAQPDPRHQVGPSLHRNSSYRSESGRDAHQLISETAKILLEMEAMRQQQRRASQATLETYDNVRSSYASGLDQPTGWSYRPGPSQHRRTSSIRRDWSLPPLPDRVSSLPRRSHQQ